MKRPLRLKLLQGCSVALVAVGAVGCVDHDYDLSEDIDLTISLGGDNLTVPGSSTEQIFLSKILDLNEGSSIKAVEVDGMYGLAKGDYVLLQEGSSSPSYFDVEEVSIGHINGSKSTTALPEFYNVTGATSVSQTTQMILNTMRLSDDNVTTDLVSLSSADVDVNLTIAVGYTSPDFSGTAYIEKGYDVVFDPCWTVEPGDAATAAILENVDYHTLRFKQRYGITASRQLVAKVRITHADLTKVPQGQGLYAPGKFFIENEVETYGNVSIDLADLPIGARANISVVTDINVSDARLLKVRGIVDPKIDIAETTFDINDIPDFLSDPANNLDMSNPQITLSIVNNSPLSITLEGMLASYADGKAIAEVGIGASYGTAAIVANANATTDIVISREPVASAANNVVVPDLSSLLATVPDRICFHDAKSKAVAQPAEFVLGSTYTFDCDYNAVIPLAFGDAMQLHYTHIENEWDEDLSDYDFNTAVVTADVINTIPLDMTPSAAPLNVAGDEFTNVDVTVDGKVPAGTVDKPSKAQISITLQSKGATLDGLDGVKLLFDAIANRDFVGVNLNENQSIKFENIRITIKGGVLVDLN